MIMLRKADKRWHMCFSKLPNMDFQKNRSTKRWKVFCCVNCLRFA